MNTEPSYMSSLGEFATLKNAIGCWYHQDAYLDFNTDEDIWADMLSGHDLEARSRLKNQLSEVLRKPDDEILTLWNSEADCHRFSSGAEARSFLASMLAFFESPGQ